MTILTKPLPRYLVQGMTRTGPQNKLKMHSEEAYTKDEAELWTNIMLETECGYGPVIVRCWHSGKILYSSKDDDDTPLWARLLEHERIL